MAKTVVSAATAAAPEKPGRRGGSLRARLNEAEETLAAIRAGDVDAVVVGGPAGDRVFTLEGAEHGYRVLMEAMSEGVATLTEEGIVTYCNARFVAILGAQLELTIGNPISQFVPEADLKPFEALVAAGTRGRSEGEFWLKAPSAGASALVRLAVVALTLNGARTHCVVMTDLTEQRRQSTAIAAERAQMQTRLLLADRMSSLGTLAVGVAHEINNPLAYVAMNLALIQSRLRDYADRPEGLAGEPAEWLASHVARAQEGTERVRVIVRDLKAFSQADDETMAVVDPRKALGRSIALASNEIRHRARLMTDYDALPPVWANEARLGQVFLNLLINATQAIPAGAAADNEIRVSGHTDPEGRAVIEIRDTGSGIDPAHLPLVFDPFFTTKAPNEGPGLGLSLCHSIVASLDGQITVRSEPGAGSVFRVTLQGVEHKRSTPPPAPAAPAPAARRGRLLVIDDEPDIGEVLYEALSPSHHVVTMTDAHGALELLAASNRFDLILCDMRMPAMTGLDFHARLVNQDPIQADLVVLMSGGFTDRRGAPPVVLPTRFLAKPFTLEQVTSLLHEAMQRQEARSAPVTEQTDCETQIES